MELPDYLYYNEVGEIRFQGHRIGLHHLLWPYRDGASIDVLMADHYPSLGRPKIEQAVDFYLKNRQEIDAYLDKQQRDEDEIYAQYLKENGPRVEELRERVRRYKEKLSQPNSPAAS